MRKTKIVCTLGPSTDKEGILRQLIENGMNVARFNFSHGDHEEHRGRLEALKKLRAELEARADEVQAQMQRGAFFGAGRLVKAFPRMRHGRRGLPLDALRRQEDKDRGRDGQDGPSA